MNCIESDTIAITNRLTYIIDNNSSVKQIDLELHCSYIAYYLACRGVIGSFIYFFSGAKSIWDEWWWTYDGISGMFNFLI